MMEEIVKASTNEVETVAQLALQLWTEHSPYELCEEFSTLFTRKDAAVFLACVENESVGFAQCQLRYDYVEGTDSSPVGYLEGIFVKPEFRKRGIAKNLLNMCQVWAKERGCTEFASDCELTNIDSLRFHLQVGFEEANRIICFTKKL